MKQRHSQRKLNLYPFGVMEHEHPMAIFLTHIAKRLWAEIQTFFNTCLLWLYHHLSIINT